MGCTMVVAGDAGADSEAGVEPEPTPPVLPQPRPSIAGTVMMRAAISMAMAGVRNVTRPE